MKINKIVKFVLIAIIEISLIISANYLFNVKLFFNNINNFVVVFLTIIGIALTIYTFLQSTTITLQEKIIKNKNISNDIILQFDKVMKELGIDIKIAIINFIIFVFIVCFFKNIENTIFNRVQFVIGCFTIINLIFSLLDLSATLIKYSKINAKINEIVLESLLKEQQKDNQSNKDEINNSEEKNNGKIENAE